MKKLRYLSLLIVFMLGLALFAVACGGSSQTTSSSPTGTSTTSTSPSGTTTSQPPNQIDFTAEQGFFPPVLTVPVGTEVTWFNRSSQRIWVSSPDKTPDTGLIGGGSHTTFTFTQPGTFTYYNLYNKDQTGTVVVQ
jgi:plastocyanin